MTITLYHVPRTISSPLVQILLELDLVDNPIAVHEMTFSELKSKSYLKTVNPMGTSPAFCDDELGITLFESGAIVDYILERYDVHNQLHPAPIVDYETAKHEQIWARAKYLQIKQYILATVYPFAAALYLHTLKEPAAQDAEYIETAQRKWRTVIGPVLTSWLGDGPYFMGDNISAVTMLMAKPLTNLHAMGLLNDDFPALAALYERVSNRPSYRPAYDRSGLRRVQIRVVDTNKRIVPTVTTTTSILSTSSRHSPDNDPPSLVTLDSSTCSTSTISVDGRSSISLSSRSLIGLPPPHQHHQHNNPSCCSIPEERPVSTNAVARPMVLSNATTTTATTTTSLTKPKQQRFTWSLRRPMANNKDAS